MDKNAYLLACQNRLAERRARAQNICYLNLVKARSHPEFSDLDKQEKSIIYDIGRCKAFNQEHKLYDENLQKVRQKKLEALASVGLTEEDIEPQYTCKKCNDIGYVNGRMCSCLKEMLNKMLVASSGAGKDKLNDFKDFDSSLIKNQTQKTTLLKLKKKFEDYAKTFPLSCPKNIILCGKTGVGKTFLTECLAKAIIDRGYLVSFVSAFGMNNLFLGYHTSFDESKQAYLNALIDPDVLVIDDLGTEPILKNVTREYLLLVLSERSRLNKLTITTTNLEPDGILARYNERIFSRLFNKRESFVAKILGDDLRLQ